MTMPRASVFAVARIASFAILGVAVSVKLVLAADLALPGAVLTAEDTSPASSVRLPDAAWEAGNAVVGRDGHIRRRAYTFPESSLTTLQLMDPATQILLDDGFDVAFRCADAACGGFDFRFSLDLLREPDMHVDLGDFRYLLATRDTPDGAEFVSMVSSRSQTAGFLHVTELRPLASAAFSGSGPVKTVEPAVIATPRPSIDDPIGALIAFGHIVLDDLVFQTGSSELGEGDFASLTAIADWLLANPSGRIALVGHTDAVGSLEANKALSLRRATAVAARLTGALGANPAQIEAEGAGYLAPRASNLTEEGRGLNRRVEAVLLDTQ